MKLPEHPEIEVWPVIGRLAIALRETVVFRFWSVLLDLVRRQGRRANSVIVHLDDLLVCGIESPRTLRRYMERAQALGYARGYQYLGKDRWRVYFTGQARLRLILQARAESKGVMNADEWDRRKVFIPASAFATITEFEEAVFAGWVSVARGYRRNATWAALQQMWQVTRQAMEVWLHRNNLIERKPRYGTVPHSELDCLWSDPHVDPEASHLNHGSKRPGDQRHYQRGNAWITTPHFAARGQARLMFANSQLDQPATFRCDDQRHSETLARKTLRQLTHLAGDLRTNFTHWESFVMARLNRPREALYFLKHTGRNGSQIWQLYRPLAMLTTAERQSWAQTPVPV